MRIQVTAKNGTTTDGRRSEEAEDEAEDRYAFGKRQRDDEHRQVAAVVGDRRGVARPSPSASSSVP